MLLCYVIYILNTKKFPKEEIYDRTTVVKVSDLQYGTVLYGGEVGTVRPDHVSRI
jgi:hypothetical protein